ncbi:MAG: glycosyltransferase [Planctomycetes bacterium]|nr:glycosyltransferase [Planctomycetota bacterium]
MDVLHLIHQFPPESRGGSESYVLDIARRQRAVGQDAQVLSGSKHWRDHVLVETGEVEGIPVHRLHRSDQFFDFHAKMWHPEVEHQITELLQRWRPRLVHVHHWVRLTSNLVEICARLGIPAVVTLHDYYTSCPRAFRRRLNSDACTRTLGAASCVSCVPRYGYEPEREVAAGVELFADNYRAELSLAHAVIVAVGSTAELLATTAGVPRERYEVLPLGYRQRWPGQPPLPAPAAAEPLRFAFWGGIGRHKGIDVLLRAFRRLHVARPGRAVLHLLGGAESPAFDREVKALAEGLPVTLHGEFDAAALRAVAPHVGVFPSTCIETYGIVLDECFELGLPCVTSDLGALAERSGAAGLRTRAGDEAGLAATLQRFVDEPGLWGELRGHVQPTQFGLDAHVTALQQIYDRALSSPAPAPFAAPVPALRRVLYMLDQRESAMVKLVVDGGPK